MRSTCFAPCYRSAQLQSPSPLYVCRAGGTRGARGIAPVDSKSNVCSMKRINCIIASPTQVFRPSASPVCEGKSINSWQKQDHHLSKDPICDFGKKTCVPSNLHNMFYSSYNHVKRAKIFFYISI